MPLSPWHILSKDHSIQTEIKMSVSMVHSIHSLMTRGSMTLSYIIPSLHTKLSIMLFSSSFLIHSFSINIPNNLPMHHWCTSVPCSFHLQLSWATLNLKWCCWPAKLATTLLCFSRAAAACAPFGSSLSALEKRGKNTVVHGGTLPDLHQFITQMMLMPVTHCNRFGSLQMMHESFLPYQ